MGIGRLANPLPISFEGGPVTVILVHGFTGSPAEMQLLAEACHQQGYAVEVPLLEGHGTVLDDLVPMQPQRWIDQLDGVIRTQLERGQQVVLGGAVDGFDPGLAGLDALAGDSRPDAVFAADRQPRSAAIFCAIAHEARHLCGQATQ